MTRDTEFKEAINAKLLAHLNLAIKHEAMIKAIRKATGLTLKKLRKEHNSDCKGCIIEDIQMVEAKSLEIHKEIQGLLTQSSYFLIQTD